MNYKPEESTLIAYIYNELSESERKKVEAYLSGNEKAKLELDELRSTLSIIGKLEDKEVDVPTFTFNDTSHLVIGSKNQNWWKIPLSIAASIALLMVVGYLTSFKVSSQEGEIKIAFGEIENANDLTFTESQVKAMISEALDQNNQLVNQKIENTQADLVNQMNQNDPELDQKLLNNYLVRLRSYNAETIAGLLEESEQEQRRYTDQVIQDFAIFLDLQRQDDMELIQTQFENINENAERFSMQTDQILTNLMTSENTQIDNQY
ncbi:anti-sigma factor family protein [Ekhidna sp.]|uniref:anti-sigma factor family protein n=1 Tax=Ekhidna sp. TaxID=2608089 RepID=UPI003B50D204